MARRGDFFSVAPVVVFLSTGAAAQTRTQEEQDRKQEVRSPGSEQSSKQSMVAPATAGKPNRTPPGWVPPQCQTSGETGPNRSTGMNPNTGAPTTPNGTKAGETPSGKVVEPKTGTV